MPRLLLLGLAVLVTGVVASPAFAQCAMCQATLVGSSEGRAMAGELNRAILVMFAAPYAVFGTVLAVVFRRPLRERAAGFGRRLLGVAAPVIKLVPRRGRPHSDA